MLLCVGAAFDRDGAVVLLHDALTYPEAQAGALLAFGGEERLEELGQDLSVDAFSLVGDGDGNAGGSGFNF